MKRERALDLAEQMLQRLEAGAGSWPLRIVTELYVFGSFARGATEPHDLDIYAEVDNSDEEWLDHFIGELSIHRDPYTLLRRSLGGHHRGYQFLFEGRARFDFPLTLLWQRGEPTSTALQRLHAIPVDPDAGRAPRNAMLPELDGLDRWIPRTYREHLAQAVNDGSVRLERIELADAPVHNAAALDHINQRWKPTSPTPSSPSRTGPPGPTRNQSHPSPSTRPGHPRPGDALLRRVQPSIRPLNPPLPQPAPRPRMARSRAPHADHTAAHPTNHPHPTRPAPEHPLAVTTAADLRYAAA